MVKSISNFSLMAFEEKNMNLLLLTNDKQIYIELRKIIDNLDFNSVNLVYSQDEDLYSHSKKIITSRNDYVFLANQDIYYPLNTLKELFLDFNRKKYAGFISGYYQDNKPHYIKDIYNDQRKYHKVLENSLTNRLISVDIYSIYGIMMNHDVFNKCDFSKPDLFGLDLRKLGYENFINLNITYKKYIEEK